MANLALMVEQTSHDTTTRARTMLESLGHTVTVFAATQISDTVFDPFDLIVTNRYSDTPWAGVQLAKWLDKGKPIIAGGVGGLGNGSRTNNHVSTVLGLAYQLQSNSGVSSIYALPHPIWDEIGIVTPATVAVYPSSTWGDLLFADSLFTNDCDILAQVNDTTANIRLAIAWKGNRNGFGKPFRANFAFVGYMYGLNGYTAEATNVIGAIINKFLNPPYRVSGTVTDGTGNPLHRRVQLMRRSDGELIDEKLSDAATGAYSFDVWQNVEYTVVCHDADGESLNARVFDKVLPVAVV